MSSLPSPSLALEPEAGGSPRREWWRAQWKQFRRSRLALPGLLLFGMFVLAGLLAPWIAPYSPYENDLANIMATPSAAHWFGTDELGRDIFTRILYGARISLVEGVVSALLAALVGVPIGMLSGYAGKRVDAVIMRLIDVLLAFPGVLLAIVIISILGPSLANAILAVAIYTIPIFARFARGQTLAVKEEPYIEACRAMGMTDLRILARHVFPNIFATLFALATLRVGINILTCASLSFLGLGAQAPLPEWGAMLANSRTALLIAPHLAIFPGVAILLLVFGLNLFQDGLQLVLDPKSRGRT
jgi:ABC-type dipeptide/oligopeptide/nickel transport system permease subunit